MKLRPRSLAALSLVALTACSPTTYDAAAGTTDPPATTSTLPVGTVEELLPLMQQEIEALPALVVSGDGDGASASRIEEYWAAIKPQIEDESPDLVEDFEFIVRLCRTAADRNRPANADRAARNMKTLVDAMLG
ncbi:MAG: hypothetical protein Q7V57_18925 [Actinomycetota bacterium]|nr:hypothetical protein [Actinomycetota bacterium]